MIDAFKAYLELHYASHTVRAYMQDLTSFITWFEPTTGEAFDPQAVTALDVRAYRDSLLEEQARPATINRRLAALGTFFYWAQAKGFIRGENPTATVPGIEEPKAVPRWLSRQEQQALLQKAKERGKPRDFAVISLLLNTGLRLSEICNLQLQDIVQLCEGKGSIRVGEGQGEKERIIPLNTAARQALLAYLDSRPAAHHCYVFIGQRGEPLQQGGVQRLVGEYARRADLEKCTPYTLRHSFAKNLVDTGVPLDRVAALLGHENLNTVQIYTTPSAHDLVEAVERVGG